MTLTAKMPTMPKSNKVKPSRPCACGCGGGTKSEWVPGHDGRATGWALRIERGIIEMSDVPLNEQAGAKLMLARRKAKAKAVTVQVTKAS